MSKKKKDKKKKAKEPIIKETPLSRFLSGNLNPPKLFCSKHYNKPQAYCDECNQLWKVAKGWPVKVSYGVLEEEFIEE